MASLDSTLDDLTVAQKLDVVLEQQVQILDALRTFDEHLEQFRPLLEHAQSKFARRANIVGAFTRGS